MEHFTLIAVLSDFWHFGNVKKLLFLVVFQVVIYIIISAACGGLSWPSCVHKWNKSLNEREVQEKRRNWRGGQWRPCWVLHASSNHGQEARLSFCYSSFFSLSGGTLAAPPHPPAWFLLWKCEHSFAFWMRTLTSCLHQRPAALWLETDVEH